MRQVVYAVKIFFRKADILLLALCLIASGFGLILIYSATRYDSTLWESVYKQAIFIVLGVAAYVLFSFADIEMIVERGWKFLFIGSILLLFMIIPFGVEGDTGNRSWVYIDPLPIGFQPAEIVKLAFIPLLSLLMARQREWGLSRPFSVFSMVFLTGLYAGIIAILSEDFGMVLVYLLIFVILAFAAGVKLRWFAAGGTLLAASLAAVAILWVKSESFATKFGYIIRRFTEVFTRDDPQNIGWQQVRSELAIGSGGLFGQGFLKGVQTQSLSEGSLPARHTDEIFAVCGEEFGLVGCAILLILLTAIIVRCFWIGSKARSHISAYIGFGFGAMLLIQTAINIAVCLYVFPVVGLTLPFISYGGSSILTLFAAMGIVSGIKVRYLPSWLQDRSKL